MEPQQPKNPDNWKCFRAYDELDYLLISFTELYSEMGLKISQAKLLRCLCRVGTNNQAQIDNYLQNPIALLKLDREKLEQEHNQREIDEGIQ